MALASVLMAPGLWAVGCSAAPTRGSHDTQPIPDGAKFQGKRTFLGEIGCRLTEIIIRQILAANQVPVDQVTFISLVGGDVSYMSLRAGVIDAVMLQFPNTFLAQDEGFRKITAGADYYRAVQGGLTTTKALLSEKPELTTKVVRATLRAVRLLTGDKKYGLAVLTKRNYVELGKERERFAERAYEAATQGYLVSGVVDEKLQREMSTLAAQRLKPPPQVAPERIFDSVLRARRRTGYGSGILIVRANSEYLPQRRKDAKLKNN